MSVSDVCFAKLSGPPFAAPLLTLMVMPIGDLAGAGAEAGNEDPQSARIGVMTLSHGDSIDGQLVASPSSNVIRWQGTSFVTPFEFRTAAIKSIKFPVEVTNQERLDEFAFELTSGDTITGRLAQWTSDTVTISSTQFGTMRVRTDSIRRLYRIEQNATSIFAPLAGLRDWAASPSSTTTWQEDGDQLWTNKPGAILGGDLGVPDRALVEFELSWDRHPDFVLAIGTNPDSDRVRDGWRFETVGRSLAIVRECDEAADVALVADLSQRKSIQLHAYLDQRDGQLHVFRADGSPAGRVSSSPPRNPTQPSRIGRGVRVISRDGDLRIKRLRISKWLGELPDRGQVARSRLALVDGSFASGTIRSFDHTAQSLVIGDDAQRSSIKLVDVIAANFPSAKTQPEPAQCALFLQSGMRLSGNLESITDQSWVLSAAYLQADVRIPRHRVRSVIVFEHEDTATSSHPSQGRPGKLQWGSHYLSGCVSRATGPKERREPVAEASPLGWHPIGSINPACLKRSFAGRIIYRELPQADMTTTAARALEMQMLRKRQQKRGLDFGELFLQRVDRAKSDSDRRDVHQVHIRSGDAIPCRVASIDDRGVHLSTAQSDHRLLPHANVKAIELAANSPPPDLQAAKRERLLTIPRLQQSSPPTHLICSHSGDFLRCRLTRLDHQSVRVLVQMQEIEIPRDRVAQIIWFHGDEIETTNDGKPDPAPETASESPLDGRVQVLRPDGRRVTFKPTRVTDDEIAGMSEIIGECRLPLSDVDQLILGSRIAMEVSDLAYNRWRLRPAVQPLFVQQMADATSDAGESELVGQPAPDIKLELLSGEFFQLSDCEGQIVVLDFWASWCAPCMQTMPLLADTMSRFDTDKVRLVSINVEELADRIKASLELHQLELTVALDVDGVTAERYQAQAIPQTVIVGADGKVERMYVGGGTAVVEQVKTAIGELLEEM